MKMRANRQNYRVIRRPDGMFEISYRGIVGDFGLFETRQQAVGMILACIARANAESR